MASDANMPTGPPEFVCKPRGDIVAQQSWQAGRRSFRRLTAGAETELIVETHPSQPEPEHIRLRCDHVGGLATTTSQISFSRRAERRFGASIIFATAGVRRCSLEYCADGIWHCQQGLPAWFLVDPPWLAGLSFYTLIPAVSGTIADWTAELPRIRDLGFNALMILPMTVMDESDSPYAARDLLAIDPTYLDPDDPRSGLEQFRSFAEQVRDHGLRLCVDLVLNHVGRQSTIVRSRPQWIVEDEAEADGMRRAGWSDGADWHKWDDVVLLNYDTPDLASRDEMRAHMIRYARTWAEFAAITDGILRLDNLHSSNHGFVQQVLAEIRTEFPGLAVFGELFGAPERTEALVLDYGLNLLLATPWEKKYASDLRDYLQGLHNCADRLRFFAPINSHDSGSPAEEFGGPAAVLPRLVVSALLGPGPWGIVQGVEYGIKERLRFIGRQDRFVGEADSRIAELLTWLNGLISANPVLQEPGNVVFVDNGHGAVLGGVRIDPDSRRPEFLILANLDLHQEQVLDLDLYEHGFHVLGDLVNCRTKSRLPLRDGRGSLRLAPAEYLIFSISN